MAANDKHPQREAYKENTLPDLAKRVSNGMMLPVVKALARKDRMFEDMLLKPSNQDEYEEYAYETALQKGQWTDVGQGVIPEKSDQSKNTQGMGSLEGLSRLPLRINRFSGNVNELRRQEDMRYLRGMSHTMIEAVIYGNPATDPRQFLGFAPRYATLSDTNVYDAGGTGNNLMSLWFLNWDIEEGCYIIYPKNSNNLGISTYNAGALPTTDTQNGGEYITYRTFFEINWGLVVKRQDMCARYANLEKTGSSNIFDDDTGIEILNFLWENQGVVIYGNRWALTQLDKLANNKSNAYYTVADIFGEETTMFRKKPVKLCESLIPAETALVS